MASGTSSSRPAPIALQEAMDSWFVRHVYELKATMRIIIGIVFLIDGALKFQPGTTDNILGMIDDAAAGQPAWLAPWFSLWKGIVGADPALFVYGTAVLEVLLAVGLILGLLRKITYTVGFFLSLLIWAVPEGFGGPYGPSSTDIGTGIVYAFVFLFLLILNATFGPSDLALDVVLERRWPWWRRVAELRGHASDPGAVPKSFK